MRLSWIVSASVASGKPCDNKDFPVDRIRSSAGRFGAGASEDPMRQSRSAGSFSVTSLRGAHQSALHMDLARIGISDARGRSEFGLCVEHRHRSGWMGEQFHVAATGWLVSSRKFTYIFRVACDPALLIAGNLGSWVPQLRIEHRITLGDKFESDAARGGIIDSRAAKPPVFDFLTKNSGREAIAPAAYAKRVGLVCNCSTPLRIGAAGLLRPCRVRDLAGTWDAGPR